MGEKRTATIGCRIGDKYGQHECSHWITIDVEVDNDHKVEQLKLKSESIRKIVTELVMEDLYGHEPNMERARAKAKLMAKPKTEIWIDANDPPPCK